MATRIEITPSTPVSHEPVFAEMPELLHNSHVEDMLDTIWWEFHELMEMDHELSTGVIDQAEYDKWAAQAHPLSLNGQSLPVSTSISGVLICLFTSPALRNPNSSQ